jgi:hypothetical protein
MPARTPYTAHLVKILAVIVAGCGVVLLTQPWSSATAKHTGAIGHFAAAAPGVLKPPRGGAAIRVLTVNGSGCPYGTVRIRELPQLDGFTATYADLRAEITPATILGFRKNCQFSVLLQAPPRYAYTAVSAQYAGRAMLARGARGLQETSYYFQGLPQTVSMSHPLSGPLNGPWQHAEHVMLSALGKEACGQGRILNINAQLEVYPSALSSGAANYVALDSASHGYTIYRFNRTGCFSTGSTATKKGSS